MLGGTVEPPSTCAPNRVPRGNGITGNNILNLDHHLEETSGVVRRNYIDLQDYPIHVSYRPKPGFVIKRTTLRESKPPLNYIKIGLKSRFLLTHGSCVVLRSLPHPNFGALRCFSLLLRLAFQIPFRNSVVRVLLLLRAHPPP